jgi:transposase InsO family protein
LICSFIDQMRAQRFRVESICRVLTEQGVAVAGRTYRNWKKAAPSARTVTDAGFTDALLATVDTPEGSYGRRKMTAHLRRQGHGHQVAACTVDRLMGDEGLSGVLRGRVHRTTIPGGKDSRRAPDLLDRDFTATRTQPQMGHRLHLLQDVVGFRLRRVRDRLLLPGHRGVARRDGEGHRDGDHGAEDGVVAARSRRPPSRSRVVHHSDAGSQYTSIAFAETLVLEGIAASIGVFKFI